MLVIQHVQEITPNLELKYKKLKEFRRTRTSPGELEGVPSAEAVRFFTAFIVQVGVTAVLV
jgi:hypothetical protein